MEYKENANIENAAKEMIEIVRKYKFTMGEFDQATYGVREYFNKYARLPEVDKVNKKEN
ncbi:hypothetical protein NH288_05380 [Anaerococcus sp. NML200537]|uniref:hypothetical protein n=1 Tax=Anaerococcus sp. NML200537 TaxID=2954485 RepID=UPI002236F094|nr:hypothetical protein [Anaerococcus sp. NML200537]MCW6701515.1 hypothetical protein [Anaerococcus sp. NML200537]